jgi:hypothetical protein
MKRKENLLPRFTPKRSFYVMYFKRTTKSEVTAPEISYITVEYKKFHDKPVHGYVDMTRRAARTLGISIKLGMSHHVKHVQ